MPTIRKGRRASSAALWLAAAFAVFSVVSLGLAGVLWQSPAPSRTAEAAGGPFNLIDGNGKQVSDQDFRGKYLLIYFGYTACPDACPTTLMQVTEALKLLGVRGEQIQPLFITVDPQRDTPAVIKQYAASFSPRLIGLTGTTENIKAAEDAYHVYAQIRPADAPGAGYTVDHSSVLFFMGPEGRFIAALPAEQTGTKLAAQISGLLAAKAKS